ncbi:tail protein X [Pseudomonas oryzihabitans]|uniref:Phage tail protein X n=1 Tax=Pseudomonas oryzihabitans TaxID=47885 RepID=A0AAJ2BLL9_9PSED|nr:tail protein X [Pseudomonas psychrotolerans]MDR6233526.1 phage tail protein X [Pseudomonas psychrotolerans]MDR6357434.1 phage tail protein X [Pseudomonas psychrotolerans]
MTSVLRTQQGDTLDLVCLRHYGYTRGVTEAALDYNPGLAEFGPVLPIGTPVTLPDVPTTATAGTAVQQPVNLWD